MTTDSTVISISKRGLCTVCHSAFDSSVVLSVWSLFYMKKSSEIIIVENIRSQRVWSPRFSCAPELLIPADMLTNTNTTH